MNESAAAGLIEAPLSLNPGFCLVSRFIIWRKSGIKKKKIICEYKRRDSWNCRSHLHKLKGSSCSQIYRVKIYKKRHL